MNFDVSTFNFGLAHWSKAITYACQHDITAKFLNFLKQDVRPVHHSELVEWLLAKSAGAIKELPSEEAK